MVSSALAGKLVLVTATSLYAYYSVWVLITVSLLAIKTDALL
jgi:hypothetical protein